jgi:hypothetical protein
VLAALPPEVVVAVDGEARLVAGPAGAFVLLPTPPRGPVLAEAARRVHELARQTRCALCDHVSWVPFLDTLLVSTSRLVRRTDVTVAPVDLLAVLLTEGPQVIDRATLAAVRRAVKEAELGRWTSPAGREPTDRRDRIERCDPAEASRS